MCCNRQHERRKKSPIMRVIPALVGDELRIDQALPDTQAGRDAAVEIRSGLMRGLSVSFQAQRQAFRGRRAAYPVGRDDGDRISRFTVVTTRLLRSGSVGTGGREDGCDHIDRITGRDCRTRTPVGKLSADSQLAYADAAFTCWHGRSSRSIRACCARGHQSRRRSSVFAGISLRLGYRRICLE